jgi:hypothetical protein
MPISSPVRCAEQWAKHAVGSVKRRLTVRGDRRCGSADEIAPCRLSFVGGVEFPEKRFDGVGIAYCFVVEPCLDEFPVDRLA